MILYYSATGNSKWIATKIAEGTMDEARNITNLIRQGVDPASIQIKDKIGIVFPIYAWRAPQVVVDFIKRLNVPEKAYRYVIGTCGGQAGKTMDKLEKDFKFDAAWSILMPDNYIRMWDINSHEVALQKVEAAEQKLPSIISAINSRESVKDVDEGGWKAPLLSGFINRFFVKYYNKAKGYHVEEGCTSCGLCTTVCVYDNITLNDEGIPVWGNTCNQCGACIHNCPEKCIQYKNVTQKRGRYNFYRDFKDKK